MRTCNKILYLIIIVVLVFNTTCCDKTGSNKIFESFEANNIPGEVIPFDLSANGPYLSAPPFVSYKNELIIYYDWYLKSVVKRINLPGEYFGYNRIYVSGMNHTDSSSTMYYFVLSKTPENSNYITILKRPADEMTIGNYFKIEKIKDISIGDLNLIAVAKNDGIENFTYVCQNKSQTSVSFLDKNGVLRNSTDFLRPVALSTSFSAYSRPDIYGFDGKDVFFYFIDKYTLVLKNKITLRNNYSKIFEVASNDKSCDIPFGSQISVCDGENLYLLDFSDLKKTYEISDFKGCSLDRRFLYIDDKLLFSEITSKNDDPINNTHRYYVKDGILDSKKNFDQIFSSGYDLIHYCTGYWSEDGYIFSIYYYKTTSPKSEIFRHNFGPFEEKITSYSEDKRTLVLYGKTLIYFYNKGPDWEDDLEVIPLNESALDK